MTQKKRINQILQLLDLHYGDQTKCYLHYEEPWQLLVATILSAQCTDDRVNQTTPALFAAYPSMEALAYANISDVEVLVHPTGFYRNKAKSIIGAMKDLVEQHKGVMPSQIELLTKLPGVGRKTANVIISHVFGLPSIVVDTHVKRVSHRLGLTKQTDPTKIEFELMKILPKKHWSRYNTQIIAHGRAICKSQSPHCNGCFLAEFCLFANQLFSK